MKFLFKGKSKFYKEYMTNLITDVLCAILGILFIIGIIWFFISII